MIKITKTNWRAFIELNLMNGDGTESGDVLYFDVTKRPNMVATKEGNTLLMFSDTVSMVVKESMKDIIKAVDKLIKEEKEKQAAENEAQVNALMEKYKNGQGTGNK